MKSLRRWYAWTRSTVTSDYVGRWPTRNRSVITERQKRMQETVSRYLRGPWLRSRDLHQRCLTSHRISYVRTCHTQKH